MNRKTMVNSTVLLSAFIISAEVAALDFRTTFENHSAFGKVNSDSSSNNNGNETAKFSNSITSELTLPLNNGWQLFTRAMLETDTRDLIEPGEPNDAAVRSNASRRWFLNDYAAVDLREFYIDGYAGFGGGGDSFSGESFIRVGKQQVVWGQADGFRVLDAINPMNLREFILEDNEDRRIPTWLVNAEIPAGNWFNSDWTAQIVWIPDTTYDQVPSIRDEARFAPQSPRFVPSPNESDLPSITSSQIIDADKPNRWVSDSDLGIRATAYVNGWDISVNYLYHTLDRAVPYHDVVDSVFTIAPRYERSHLLGTTFSSAFDSFTFRGEIAFHSERFYITKNTAKYAEGITESSTIDTVFGVDFNGITDVFISGQMFVSHITDFDAETTRDKTDLTFSLLIDKHMLNETLTVSGQWFYNTNDGDGLLRLSTDYQWRSNIILSAGVDSFYGKDIGLFGQFNQQDQVTVGFSIDF